MEKKLSKQRRKKRESMKKNEKFFALLEFKREEEDVVSDVVKVNETATARSARQKWFSLPLGVRERLKLTHHPLPQ
jgi:hypothetical protein